MDLDGTRLFEDWLEDLERRHLADLAFAEVRRALQSLSARYVAKRARLSESFDGAGKRAAYALFYGPLHYLVVERVVREAGLDRGRLSSITDLGCGTGAGGAAWAVRSGGSARLTGIDRNGWAVGEARRTWRRFGLTGQVRRGDLERERIPGAGSAALAAYALNELPRETRDAALERLLAASVRGTRILIVEPISRSVSPGWDAWARRFEAAGGRADEWRFSVALPELLERFDRAAGLDHRELTARSLAIALG